MRALAVDVGGTKVSLALASREVAAPGERGRVKLAKLRRYPSAEFTEFELVVRAYLDEVGLDSASLDGASVAVAGPVEGDRCRTTNLPWLVDAGALEQRLSLPRVRLLNDLEAIAWAVPGLAADQLALLHPGADPAVGNACVVAAGTGLGEAGLAWDGARHHPFATEGGHASFGPCDARERALLEFLARIHGHVSWERVASGMGIVNLHDFLVEYRKAEPADWVEDARASGQLAAWIAAEAEAERCAICVETMDLFATLLGRAAGNAALAYLARGGVYLGGGVAQRNRGLLERDMFLAGYFDRGRMRPVVEQIPVYLILEAEAALFGAFRALAAA